MLGIGAIIAYVDAAFHIRVKPRVLTRTAQAAEEVAVNLMRRLSETVNTKS